MRNDLSFLLSTDCIMNYTTINYVDICCGLNWGDEAKGKLIAHLAKTKDYHFVCRWAGGNNAGHTIYVNGKKFKTHLIPCGIFHNIVSVIGPDCVVNIDSFRKEIEYLQENGFNTNLVKISPRAHVITENHIKDDKKYYASQGTTSCGIAPCYRDKYARIGVQAKDIDAFEPYLWDEKLFGNVLCEGAQGFWLDINQGNYPYVTSSTTLPYGACSLGFPPQTIRNIYGASKIYDTRSGTDPLFPESLLTDPELSLIIDHGKEYGTTTGRKRKVNWLNLNKLIHAINVSGTTHIIISKNDVLVDLNIFKIIFDDTVEQFEFLDDMQNYISNLLMSKCKLLKNVFYSSHNETVHGL